MTVYIVQTVWEHEGSKIVGVYDDMVRAVQCKLEEEKRNFGLIYCEVKISIYELNEDINEEQ